MSDPFQQARQHFLEGVAHFEAGRAAEAAAAFEASLRWLPGRVSTLVNLAATLLKLGRPRDALQRLDEALAGGGDDADLWLHRGVALAQLGRHEQALDCFDRVPAQAADRPATWHHRAASLTALRRHAQALQALQRLLALAPDDAQAWLRQGQALQYLDRHDEAFTSYERALALDAGLAQAWTNLAHLRKARGQVTAAAGALRRAIACGGDPALNGYYLAALTGEAAPAAPPRRYVEQLFDDYADSFDAHLVGALGYRAHEVLVAPLRQAGGRRYRSALDLGCGTGLCGPLVRPIADRIDGVDLSAAMLDKARALGVYTQLEQADLLEHLDRTPQRHDLVLAADVFIYVGALQAVFAAVQRVLLPGGMFCFSVERADDAVDFELRTSLRYAHSARHLRALAQQHGFDAVQLHHAPIRHDQQAAIEGLYVYLRRR